MSLIKPLTLGISVYLNDYIQDKRSVEQYINSASQIGYKDVFTSIHLPEEDFQKISGVIGEFSELITQFNLKLIVDCSYYEIEKFRNSPSIKNQIQRADISFFRLDFGFNIPDMHYLIEEVNASGLMLNASMLNKNEISHIVNEIWNIDKTLPLQACHNFYPRPETGLAMDYFIKQSSLFQEMGIPVISYLPAKNTPRAPVYQGLPTIEKHRNVSIGWAARELIATRVIDEIIIGDPFASISELTELKNAVDYPALILRVDEEPDISQTEKGIMYENVHIARPDVSDLIIRSDTSREMASIGKKLLAKPPKDRDAYSITVDNEKYGRYSGELQIMRQSLPMDERVNVIGKIIPQDTCLLSYVIAGVPFRFQKK